MDHRMVLNGHGTEERLRGANGPSCVFRNDVGLLALALVLVLMLRLPLGGRDRGHGLRAVVRASRSLVLGSLDRGAILIKIHLDMMLLPVIRRRRLLHRLFQHLLSLLLTLLMFLLVSRGEEMTEIFSRFYRDHLRLLRVGYVDVAAVGRGQHFG